jgi:YidC/Oxa1 family membrane protein insertase
VDNRRLFLAALLSLGVLVLWQWFFPPPAPVDKPAPGRPAQSEGEEGSGGSSSTEPVAGTARSPVVVQAPDEPVEPAAPLAEEPPIEGELEQTVRLETERFVAVFTNRGAQLISFELKEERRSDGELVDLVRRRPPSAARPFAFVDDAGQALPINDALFQVAQSSSRIDFRYRGPLGDASKSFALEQAPVFSVEASLRGAGPWARLVGPGIRDPRYVDLDNRSQEGAR